MSRSIGSDEPKGKEVPNGDLDQSRSQSITHGDVAVLDDAEVSDFYGSAVSETYRLKSELIAAHLAEIGMGK